MRLLAISWIVLTPWAFAALLSASARARAAAARHYVSLVVVGWTGVGLLAAGAFALTGAAQAEALLVGAPLAGLSFWALPGTYCPSPPSHE